MLIFISLVSYLKPCGLLMASHFPFFERHTVSPFNSFPESDKTLYVLLVTEPGRHF